MHCRLDSAAYEEIEYCIDKDFTKDLSFSQKEWKTEFNKRYVGGVVTQRKVRNEWPKTHRFPLPINNVVIDRPPKQLSNFVGFLRTYPNDAKPRARSF